MHKLNYRKPKPFVVVVVEPVVVVEILDVVVVDVVVEDDVDVVAVVVEVEIDLGGDDDTAGIGKVVPPVSVVSKHNTKI